MTEPTMPYLRAYYHEFTITGCPAVDGVLEAIALAGRAYHHTADWGDEEKYGPDGYWGLIQLRADAAADVFKSVSALPADIEARAEKAEYELRRWKEVESKRPTWEKLWEFESKRADEAEAREAELRAALEKIADERYFRSGYDQSDVGIEPALNAVEAQQAARQALAAAPAAPVKPQIDYHGFELKDVDAAVRAFWKPGNPDYTPDNFDMGNMADALFAAYASQQKRVAPATDEMTPFQAAPAPEPESRVAELEGLLREANGTLARAFSRIHALPRSSDTALAEAIGKLRARIDAALGDTP